MARAARTYWLIQSVSLGRLASAIIFSALAFHTTATWLLASIYCLAMVSDLIDGLMARKFQLESELGRTLDLISDKSLTVVTCLYAGVRGIDLLPLALIACREIIMIGMRTIQLGGKPLLSTNRLFGGFMAFIIWTTTLLMVVEYNTDRYFLTYNYVFWACGITYFVHAVARLYLNRGRIAALMTRR